MCPFFCSNGPVVGGVLSDYQKVTIYLTYLPKWSLVDWLPCSSGSPQMSNIHFFFFSFCTVSLSSGPLYQRTSLYFVGFMTVPDQPCLTLPFWSNVLEMVFTFLGSVNVCPNSSFHLSDYGLTKGYQLSWRPKASTHLHIVHAHLKLLLFHKKALARCGL